MDRHHHDLPGSMRSRKAVAERAADLAPRATEQAAYVASNAKRVSGVRGRQRGRPGRRRSPPKLLQRPRTRTRPGRPPHLLAEGHGQINNHRDDRRLGTNWLTRAAEVRQVKAQIILVRDRQGL